MSEGDQWKGRDPWDGWRRRLEAAVEYRELVESGFGTGVNLRGPVLVRSQEEFRRLFGDNDGGADVESVEQAERAEATARRLRENAYRWWPVGDSPRPVRLSARDGQLIFRNEHGVRLCGSPNGDHDEYCMRVYRHDDPGSHIYTPIVATWTGFDKGVTVTDCAMGDGGPRIVDEARADEGMHVG